MFLVREPLLISRLSDFIYINGQLKTTFNNIELAYSNSKSLNLTSMKIHVLITFIIMIQKTIKEAMQSWVRLKPEDKAVIQKYYEEYYQRKLFQRKQLAACFKNMEPYLRKKSSKL